MALVPCLHTVRLKLSGHYCSLFGKTSRTTVSLPTKGNFLQELVFLNANAKPMEQPSIMECFQWTGRRIGDATSALIINNLRARFQSGESTPTECGNQLIKAFSNAACLRNLRQFEINLSCVLSDWHRVFESFSDWVLEQTVSLVACNLTFGRSFSLAAGALTLQWLRHRNVSSHLFHAASFNAAKQPPVLETMRISGFYGDGELDLVDVSGCLHLRRLAIEGVTVHQLLKRFECLLSYKPGRLNMRTPQPGERVIF